MTAIGIARTRADVQGDAAALLARYDGRVPRYTSYPTAPLFSRAVGAGVYARWLAESPADTRLSLYLHPFCDRLCLYCGCLGVRDLEPSVQRAIGRLQSHEETKACADAARSLGVASLNLDLIYGLPLQTEEGVARTARRALALKAHLAVFVYAHVSWMKRRQALIPDGGLPDPVARYRQLNAIHRVLTEEGGYLAVRMTGRGTRVRSRTAA